MRDFCVFRCANPNVRLSSQRGPSQMTSLAVGHPKLAKLEEIILEHFVHFQEEHADDAEASTRVIIFSEYRDSVNEITEILSRHRPIVRVMSFIGHSTAGRASKGFTQKDQLKVCWLLYYITFRFLKCSKYNRRQLGHPCITWLSTVQQDLKQHHLTLPEAADLAHNRPLWRMMSTCSATQS